MSSNTRPLLQIDALSADIGGRGVLRGISLDVQETDWLAIVGASGCGKSTLLRLIMGLRKPAKPTAGIVHFKGETWRHGDAKAERPCGMAFVPQSPAHGFDPLKKLKWQLTQLRRQNADDSDDFHAVLDQLGLPDPEDKFPHQWSRGMQQRLLLAMALLSDPKLLILDEPTSALDPIIAAQVLGEVQRLARARGFAVLMVTHDLALAARYASHIAIMEAGIFVEQGLSQVVLDAPSAPYAKDLVVHRHWHVSSHDEAAEGL